MPTPITQRARKPAARHRKDARPIYGTRAARSLGASLRFALAVALDTQQNRDTPTPPHGIPGSAA